MSRNVGRAGAIALVLLVAAAALLALAGWTRPAQEMPKVSYAYVANAADGSVSAIDLANDRVAWTLKIGERAAHGIAASPDGSFVYAGDSAKNEVVIIDAGRQAILARIPLSTSVHGIDISPDGRMLWVGGQVDDDPVKGALTAINVDDNSVVDVISPILGSASHSAFTPDGKEVWVASTSTNLVWIVDTTSRQVVAAVPLALPQASQRPALGDDWAKYLADRKLIGLNEVAISPDGRRAYAVGPAASQLFAIDVRSRRLLKSVPAGQRAHGVAVSPDGKEVWVADWAGVVNVFDAISLKQLASIKVAQVSGGQERGANHVAFSHDGQRAYVSSIGEVVQVDVKERRLLTRLSVGKEPHELSLEDWVAPGAQVEEVSKGTAAPASTSTQTAQPATDDLIQTNEQGSVTVKVTPLNLTGAGPTLDFRIVLDTHAVELNYDLLEIAALRDDQGNEYRPSAWDGGRGGHHLQGILSFPDRARIVRPGTAYLELDFRNVARIPSRTFRWALGL